MLVLLSVMKLMSDINIPFQCCTLLHKKRLKTCYFLYLVTFEMRTVHYRNVFIQLMILTQDPVSFISKRKRGHEDKIEERQRERARESKGERASVS